MDLDKTPPSFIPLKKRFNIPSSHLSPSDDEDEGRESGVPPEPTFAPPPPYKQQALVENDVRLVAEGIQHDHRAHQGHQRLLPRGYAVLDICEGRVGDLHKLGKRNISFLVLADNARENVVEAEKRYREVGFKFSAYLTCEDCFLGWTSARSCRPGSASTL